jgi:hypothetical protein
MLQSLDLARSATTSSGVDLGPPRTASRSLRTARASRVRAADEVPLQLGEHDGDVRIILSTSKQILSAERAVRLLKVCLEPLAQL